MEQNVEPLDPQKYIVLNSVQKRLLIWAGLAFFLIILPIFSVLYYRIAVERPSQGYKEVTFEIQEGESVSSISRRLGEVGVVNSEFLFKLYLIHNNLQSKIQAGVYQLPSGVSIEGLAKIFQFGTNDVKLTFLEGWRNEEYARYAASILKKVDYEEFLKLAASKSGQLFPDTYYVNIDSDEKDLLSRLTQTFDSKTKDLFASPAFKKLGLSKDQVINIAAIVEREVNDEKDRPIVAGILMRRFQRGELVGADATVQYAVAEKNFCNMQDNSNECPNKEQISQVDWWPKTITATDLDSESPYNTRKFIGLPPTPISNPSFSAIQSVIEYTPTTYDYYLTDDEGKTHYATTLEEHNQNIEKYLK